MKDVSIKKPIELPPVTNAMLQAAKLPMTTPAETKARRDYCEPHGINFSRCPVCNPPQSETKTGKATAFDRLNDAILSCCHMEQKQVMGLRMLAAKKEHAALCAAAELLQPALDYIEMKMAHTGAQNVEQILTELERVKVYSEISTGHHLGCSKTTRRVDLDATRQALSALKALRNGGGG